VWKFDVLRQTIVAQEDGGEAAPEGGAPTTAAEGQPAEGEQEQAPGFFGSGMILWLALIIGVFYFLMIRPQQKRERQRQEMLASISKGDKVVTNGGIMGKVVGLKESTLVLRVSDDPPVKIEMARRAVSQVLDTEEKGEGGDEVDDGDEEESAPAS
jgi:preprotein translocase subunit YajC